MRSHTIAMGAAGLLVAWLAVVCPASPILAAGGAAAPPAAAPPASLVPAADGPVPATASGQLPLLLQAAPPYAALAARVEELGGTVLYTFEHVGGMAITLPPARLGELAAEPRVERLRRQRLLRPAIARLDRALPPGLGGGRRLASDARGLVPWRMDPAAVQVVPVDPRDAAVAGGGPGVGPATFLGYDRMTGAAQVWETTDYGAGVLVAIIDTGIFPAHPLIEGSVEGGENLVPAAEEEAIDLDGDGAPDGRSFDWNALENHPHGTFVGGLIAGHADLLLPAASPLAASLAFYSPESVESVDSTTVKIRLFGTAPSASLYAIKVFPYDGGSAPDARVVEAIDRLLAMKESGELDTEVINMSLGGPVLDDGDSLLDRIVDAATEAGITVVVAAGNEGPSIMSAGSPASARTALAVGAAVDPLHARVGFEVFFGGEPGSAAVLFPGEAVQVADFSGRGPTADSRVKPQILATGFLNFSSTVADFDEDGLPETPFFDFGAGTSFSTPTVAGAAALLAAYGKALGRGGAAPFVAHLLTRAAAPIADFAAVSPLAQGAGFLELTRAVALLEQGRIWHGARLTPDNLQQQSLVLQHGFARGTTPWIGAGRAYDFLVRVPRSATRLEIVLPDIELSPVQNPLFGDAVELFVHSAKRGGNGDYVFAPFLVEPGTSFVYDDPEPGTMRVTLGGSLTNWGEVAGSVEVRAFTERLEPDYQFGGALRLDGVAEHTIAVPEGTAALAAVLSWEHDWSRFPTYDLDLFLEHATMAAASAGMDSPEAALVEAPAAGDWTLRVTDIGTVTEGREPYRLLVKLFDAPPPPGALAQLRAGGAGAAAAGVVAAGTQGDRAPAPLLLAVEPNPFNPATRIRFRLAAAATASARIYDAGGRLVRRLLDGARLEAGVHTLRWDGRTAGGAPAASGVYFVRLESDGGRVARKLVLAE